MQPTLYGVTSIPDFSHGIDESPPEAAHFEIPTGWHAIRDWFRGASYLNIKAKADGELERVNPPFMLLIFSIYQSLVIGGTTHSILFPPDYGSSSLEGRAGLRLGTSYKRGDQVVRMKVVNGDHLFVDRVTYNFRPPDRGEIIVFETKGIPEAYREYFRIPADQFYIKRLVGLGGETIKLGSDRHLLINGKRLDSSTPHFEKVYSFDPKDPPRESHYSGHVDMPGLAPFFREHPEGVTIPNGHYMVMGDNTMNSLDSRAWGYLPANYLIGKSFFVYWPITERFGWGYHR
jgi:signal peptidase I